MEGEVEPPGHCPDEKRRSGRWVGTGDPIVPPSGSGAALFTQGSPRAGRPSLHLPGAQIQSKDRPKCQLLRRGLFSPLGLCPYLQLMALPTPCAATRAFTLDLQGCVGVPQGLGVRRAFPTDHPAGTEAWRGRCSGTLGDSQMGCPAKLVQHNTLGQWRRWVN